jgi:phosphate/sulfate permease
VVRSIFNGWLLTFPAAGLAAAAAYAVLALLLI